jgi:hypothetical protein
MISQALGCHATISSCLAMKGEEDGIAPALLPIMTFSGYPTKKGHFAANNYHIPPVNISKKQNNS